MPAQWSDWLPRSPTLLSPHPMQHAWYVPDGAAGIDLSRVLFVPGSVEMGQGAKTTLAQIAAHYGDLPLDLVQVSEPDTDVTPYAPTIVSLMGGTNDYTFGATELEYECRRCGVALKKIVPFLATAPWFWMRKLKEEGCER